MLFLLILNFKWYNLPEDFQQNSYIIAANHLTDSDAPLILSFYYEIMHSKTREYPNLFVFAKENCFNGINEQIIIDLSNDILDIRKVLSF